MEADRGEAEALKFTDLRGISSFAPWSRRSPSIRWSLMPDLQSRCRLLRNLRAKDRSKDRSRRLLVMRRRSLIRTRRRIVPGMLRGYARQRTCRTEAIGDPIPALLLWLAVMSRRGGSLRKRNASSDRETLWLGAWGIGVK